MVIKATYEFLSLLPSVESLASRGRRLQDTASQWQKPTYSSDVVTKVVVEETSHKLLVNFVDDDRLVLAQGETKSMSLWFFNTGGKPINEIWMVSGPEDEVWAAVAEDLGDTGQYAEQVLILHSISETNSGTTMQTEILQSVNSLNTEETLRIPLPHSNNSPALNPGDNFELSLKLHVESVGERDLCLLFVYREVCICHIASNALYLAPSTGRFGIISSH